MIAFLRANPVIAICAALIVVLLAAIGFETGWGTRVRPALPPPSAKAPATVDAKVLPPLVAAAPDQAYSETVARPLFTPTRRPAPTAPTTAAATMQKGTLALQGVTIVRDLRIAMLREKTSGRVHRVELGREVNGIKVAKIEADRVVLRQGDEEETVIMTVQKAGGVPSTMAAAGGAGPFAPSSTPGGPPMASAMPGTPPGMAPSSPVGTGSQAASLVPPQSAMPAQGSPGSVVAGQPPAASAAPMTPEELLARRRARRNQQ